MLEEIKKALTEGLEKNKEDINKSIEEKVNPLSEKVDGIDERLKTVEESPKFKDVNINTKFERKYRGYDLNEVGAGIATKAQKNPAEFPMMSNEEKFHGFKKFIIDFVKAKCFHNVEAMQGIKEFYTKTNQMQEDTAGEGGYLVPEEWASEIIKLGREKTFALRECSVIPMNRDKMNVPSELTLASVSWTAEETEATAGEPTFTEVELNAKKLDGFARVTNELLEDSAYDIVSMLTEQFAYATLVELDNQVLNGTGDPTSGILTAKAGNSVVTTGDAFSTISADDFSEAIYKVGAKYRPGAKFVIGNIGLHYARTLKDSNNNPIWAMPAQAQPSTIWGVPYIESEQITDTTAASTGFAAYGNLKKVLIGRRKSSMKLDVDPYGLFTYNVTRFRIVTRWDIEVAIAAALCRIMTAA